MKKILVILVSAVFMSSMAYATGYDCKVNIKGKSYNIRVAGRYRAPVQRGGHVDIRQKVAGGWKVLDTFYASHRYVGTVPSKDPEVRHSVKRIKSKDRGFELFMTESFDGEYKIIKAVLTFRLGRKVYKSDKAKCFRF